MRRNTPKTWFSSSISTTITAIHYGSENEPNAPSSDQKTTQIPIETSSSQGPIPIPVKLPLSLQSKGAVRIQSAFRSHRIRTLVRKIFAVNSEADRYERLIRQQDTVDAVRRDERERLRLNEGLMALLLQLDSVPGIDPSVRDLRRRTSRRIVALQEVIDAVAEERVDDLNGFPSSWDEIVAGICGEWDRGNGEGERKRFACENSEFWFGGQNVNML